MVLQHFIDFQTGFFCCFIFARENVFFYLQKVTKWLAHLPIGGSPRVGPKPGRTGSGSGGIFPPARNLRDSAHCSSCWPKLPLWKQLICLPLLDGDFIFVFFCLWTRRRPEPFPAARCPIWRGHATEGWWCVNLVVPKHTQSHCQKRDYLEGFSPTKSGAECFFDPGNLSLWTRQVMTDDKRQVQPINAEWRSVRGTLTGSGWVDHVQFGFNHQLSTELRGTLYKEANI